MKKYFNVTLAEIKKIVLKPTFYILVGCLFVAIIISSFLFNPIERTSYTSLVQGDSLTRIYNNFNRESSPVEDGKVFSNNLVQSKFDEVRAFNNSDKLTELQSRVCVIFRSYFYQLEDAIEKASYNTTHLINLFTSSGDLLQYFDNIEIATSPYNYLIKSEDFKSFRNLLRSIRATLPNTREDIDSLENDFGALAAMCRSIWNVFKGDVDRMIATCQSLKRITFKEDFLSKVEEFEEKAIANLHRQEADINLYYQNNILNNNNSSAILEYKELLNDYKASVQITLLTVDNMMNIERLSITVGDASSYLGFDDVSLYKMQEDTTLYKYIIENQIKYSKALTGINFGANSGLKTNGYDFAYFLTSISSLILTLILMYFASVIFSGERHDGLMRMNLTKPISRVKLYFAKLSALLVISLVAHLLLGLLLLAIGACIYGASSGSVLISVFSSTGAFAVAPFGNYLLKIFTLFLSNAFYIILACFVSVLFANPIFSVVISYLVYAFAVVTNTLLSKMAFLKFLPFIHADLSTFFGGGFWGNNFLGSLIYNGASFALSFIYFGVVIAILIVASCQIFKRQEL